MKKIWSLIALLIPLVASAQAKKLPFVFLNQYFEYDVSDPKALSIAGQKIDWQDGFVRIENNQLVVTKQPILTKNIWNVTVRDKSNKVIFSEPDVNFNLKTSINIPSESLANAAQVCFSSKNRITQYLMCKDIKPTSPAAGEVYPKVFINKKSTTNFGRVILTSPKSNILLDMRLNAREFVKVMTHKRSIIPSTVKKNVARKDYQIKFIDLEQDNYSWEANVGYEQEAFVVPNDSLITVYQDYFNKDFSNKELELTYYTPPYKRMQISNMYSVSPYFGFSQFNGNTRTKNVSILTEYDISLRAYLLKQMPKKYKISKWFPYWTTSVNLRSVQYITSVNSFTIENASALLYNFSGSLNRSFNERLSYGLRAAIEKNTALDYTSTSNNIVSMNSVLNTELGLQGSFNLYDRGRFVSFLHAGFAFLMPTEISGSKTSVGSRTYFRSDVHYADGNKLYGIGFHYNIRQQQSEIQKFQDQTFDYTASYSVAF